MSLDESFNVNFDRLVCKHALHRSHDFELKLNFFFGLKYNSSSSQNSKSLVLAIGDFVPVRPWSDSSISCLAEIRKIWKDKNEQSLLTELRLYFLPENTPIGRNCHGEVSGRLYC